MNFMEPNAEEKVLGNEVVDRISNLPDQILGKILFNLPIKYVVATSILSKRWKNLSLVPIKLIFSDSLPLPTQENDSDSPSRSFLDFVDKYLNETLLDVPCVDGMSLTCERDYGDAKIVSWVCAALRLNAQWLSLSFSLSESNILFDGLNDCTTLVRLVLALDSELCLPEDFSLPNLSLLHLFGLTVKGEDDLVFSELIKGCPAVEELWLMNCNMTGLAVLRIESPRLKNLKMENCFADSICTLILDVPNVVGLMLYDYVAWQYSVSRFNSPLWAHINVGPSRKQIDEDHEEGHYEDDGSWRFDNCVANLVTACSNAISLYLAHCSMSALCGSSLQLPEFQNLTWLSLGDIDFDGWALLPRLLQNAPNLEKLTMEGFIDNEDGFASFQKSLPASLVCLVICLKRIEFLAFKGDEDEIKLVEYFLKNGEALQELILYSVPPDDASILRRLLMMPRQSKACQVVCLSK